MTEPTDDELDALIDEVAGLDSSNEAFRKFARAVLAKWGTPPAVAGEPFAWADDGSLRSGSTATAHRVVTHETKMGMPKAAADSFNTPLYLTPQPTQAQAGAVPLTVDEVEQLIAQWSYELHGDRARYLVRMTEQHHGIKGDQHGTE